MPKPRLPSKTPPRKLTLNVPSLRNTPSAPSVAIPKKLMLARKFTSQLSAMMMTLKAVLNLIVFRNCTSPFNAKVKLRAARVKLPIRCTLLVVFNVSLPLAEMSMIRATLASIDTYSANAMPVTRLPV